MFLSLMGHRNGSCRKPTPYPSTRPAR